MEHAFIILPYPLGKPQNIPVPYDACKKLVSLVKDPLVADAMHVVQVPEGKKS